MKYIAQGESQVANIAQAELTIFVTRLSPKAASFTDTMKCQSFKCFINLLYKAEKPSVCLTVCLFVCLSAFLVGLISQSCVHGSTSDLLEAKAMSFGMAKFIFKSL